MNTVENPPTLKVESPLWLGNSYTRFPYPNSTYAEGYTHTFGSYVGPTRIPSKANIEMAEQLLRTNPQINRNFTPGMEPFGGRSFRFLSEGAFDITWLVRASVKDLQMIVRYEIGVARPDQSLYYVVLEQQQAEFIDQAGYRKKRTRIDGLPVYLRVNDWPKGWVASGTPPTSVTLFRRGLPEHEIKFEDGNSATLQNVERFVGRWDEQWDFQRWNFYSDRLDPELSSYTTELLGYWSR